MQLLYVWIESYRNIQKQGFSFSSEFLFEYDPIGNVLTITDNPNYIPDFFGKDIVEVTGIVGKNGSGKSTVLDFYLFTQSYDNVGIYFTVYYDERSISVKQSELKINKGKDSLTFDFIDSSQEKKDGPFPIYYTPFLDFKKENGGYSYFNFSLSYMLQNDKKEGFTQYEAHQYHSLRRWIQYTKIKNASFYRVF